jgi:hypothetical protein
MPDAVEISIDSARWGAAVQVYSEKFKSNIREGLYEEWPLLLEKIISFTPPNTYAQGRQATQNDIDKTMRPFKGTLMREPEMKKIIEEMDVQAFNIVAQRVKSGPMKGSVAAVFSPVMHTGQRNARGRVGKGFCWTILGDNTIPMKKYQAEVLSHVGYAKSGWLKALDLVGGEAPAFVRKHGHSGGDVIDDHANDDDPSITAINHTPWAVRRDEGERIVNDAMLSRREAIVSKIRTKMRLAAEAAQLDTAAA